MAHAWEFWNTTTHLKSMIYLPLLVIWGIWLARNNYLFSDKGCTPEITLALSCNILTAFPQNIRVAKKREALVVEIDRTILWGFFDGAFQNNVFGGGGLLFL